MTAPAAGKFARSVRPRTPRSARLAAGLGARLADGLGGRPLGTTDALRGIRIGASTSGFLGSGRCGDRLGCSLLRLVRRHSGSRPDAWRDGFGEILRLRNRGRIHHADRRGPDHCIRARSRRFRGVRTRNLKYVERAEGWPSELYDLEADPGEARNVHDAPEYRAQREALRRELTGWFARSGAPPIAEWRATTRQQLPEESRARR